jgi:serine/threonine protein kinase
MGLTSQYWDRLLDVNERRLIGRGLFGSVYLLVDTKYVVKRQKVIRVSDDTNLELQVFKKLRIASKNNPVYRLLFCELKYVRHNVDCANQPTGNIIRTSAQAFPASFLKYHRELMDSPICIELVFPYYRNTLEQYVHSSEYFDVGVNGVLMLCMQIVAIHVLLFQIGIYHNDLHIANLMIARPAKQSRTISFRIDKKRMSLTIPASKPMLVAIDFGQAEYVKTNDETYLVQEIMYSLNSLLQTHTALDFETTIMVSGHDRMLSPFNETLMTMLISDHPKLFESIVDYARRNFTEVVPVLLQIRESEAVVSRGGLIEIDADPKLIRRACIFVRNQVLARNPMIFETIINDLSTHQRRKKTPFAIDTSMVQKIFTCSSVQRLWEMLSILHSKS